MLCCVVVVVVVVVVSISPKVALSPMLSLVFLHCALRGPAHFSIIVVTALYSQALHAAP